MTRRRAATRGGAFRSRHNQLIQFEFDTGQELEEWAEAIVAAISRLSVIGLTQTDLTAEM